MHGCLLDRRRRTLSLSYSYKRKTARVLSSTGLQKRAVVRRYCLSLFKAGH